MSADQLIQKSIELDGHRVHGKYSMSLAAELASRSTRRWINHGPEYHYAGPNWTVVLVEENG